MVYVVSKHNKPLMPTKRHRMVRHLLEEGKAVPICNNPFTIKLKYETPDIVQPLYLGIDVGRENIGIGVSKEDGECIFLSELQTNNKSIKKNMDDRRMFRHARRRNQRLRKQRKALRDNTAFVTGKEDSLRTTRKCLSREYSYPGMEESITCKVIKGAESQFNNRKKRCELTPSARQLIQMHFHAVEPVLKILPVGHIIMERNVFDFQKLENQDIKAWEYSKGPLYGYKDYKDYINSLQNGKCLLCDGKINHYHHIKPRYEGGSDSPVNIVGLCKICHKLVHTNQDKKAELLSKKEGLAKKYRISLLNSVMPRLIEEFTDFCDKREVLFSLTDGYETFKTRAEHNLPKEHYADGYAISLCGRKVNSVKLYGYCYKQRRFKKKSAANIQKLNRREYYYNGSLVAVSRNKACEQKENSLNEYMENYASTHTSEECLQHLQQLRVKPAKRTYLSHKFGKWSSIHTGDLVLYEKHNKCGTIRRCVFIATGLDVSNGKIRHETKNKDIKYCHKKASTCTPYITKVPA